ncbi:hypothetical protein [Parasegetibacter sp. NRK P23]|uniref:hypothetical protein n=1 Tax=Parasegetibacter sp. NRK P23 TaxID=2942999 RepID=UPI00204410C1|nr:hypothetical protein [Parasegetibacter sp. NRK P23]MCM5530310.1 hypothetical protein [Parasegetibacter sp. NRK P23]
MKKMLTVLSLCITLVSFGQSTKDYNDNDKVRIQKVCDTIMKLFANENVDSALEILKKNSIMHPNAIDTLKSTMNYQMDNLAPAYGSIVSYDFIIERTIKDFICKRFYILKFDKYYLKFDFILYRSNREWTITNFNYNDDILELLY